MDDIIIVFRFEKLYIHDLARSFIFILVYNFSSNLSSLAVFIFSIVIYCSHIDVHGSKKDCSTCMPHNDTMKMNVEK